MENFYLDAVIALLVSVKKDGILASPVCDKLALQYGVNKVDLWNTCAEIVYRDGKKKA